MVAYAVEENLELKYQSRFMHLKYNLWMSSNMFHKIGLLNNNHWNKLSSMKIIWQIIVNSARRIPLIIILISCKWTKVCKWEVKLVIINNLIHKINDMLFYFKWWWWLLFYFYLNLQISKTKFWNNIFINLINFINIFEKINFVSFFF